ncbi:radial spoke head protein [Carpediemonas membranifera]|uniref:Radial spoke head protein 9 homolog n=1 Tax=Carpediemonas membranifera TaxID=201153 RepID=A0A8J6E2D4_9EUKA|nr:radial spoke head protein [Carpediemonas membranifera]|eukprot:KAG9394553.1 radial spoke head protein [Carpediemonas membranifera]
MNDKFATSLVGVPAEVNAAMKLTLPVLRRDYKLKHATFWGIIQGDLHDYYICRGFLTEDIKEQPLVFYSFTGAEWAQLPPLSPKLVEAMNNHGYHIDCQKPFTGDSSLLLNPPKDEAEHDEEEGEQEAKTKPKPEPVATELHRLKMMVDRISQDTDIAPIGFYYRTSEGITVNPAFSGVKIEDVTKPAKYALKTAVIECLSKVDGVNPVPASMWVTPTLAETTPKYTWKIEYDEAEQLVLLRNQFYPGHVAYVVPQAAVCGSVYCGTGVYDACLPFKIR